MSLRPLVVAVLAALAFAVLPASGAQAISGNGKCKLAKKWGVVKRTSDAIVFIVERRSGDTPQTLYGCVKRTGARLRLADAFDDNFTSSITFDLVQVNGRYVAWQWHSIDQSCKAACPPEFEQEQFAIERVDLRTRQSLRWDDARAEGSALRLSKRGNVAWVSATPTANVFEVRVGDSAGHKPIDSGAIDASSFALFGTTLSWNNAGQRKTASLP